MAGIWPPFSAHMSHFILKAFFYLREVQNIWSCLSPPTQTTRYYQQQTEDSWQTDTTHDPRNKAISFCQSVSLSPTWHPSPTWGINLGPTLWTCWPWHRRSWILAFRLLAYHSIVVLDVTIRIHTGHFSSCTRGYKYYLCRQITKALARRFCFRECPFTTMFPPWHWWGLCCYWWCQRQRRPVFWGHDDIIQRTFSQPGDKDEGTSTMIDNVVCPLLMNYSPTIRTILLSLFRILGSTFWNQRLRFTAEYTLLGWMPTDVDTISSLRGYNFF